MKKGIQIPNQFKCTGTPQGVSGLPVWIYCLVNKNGEVRYVGSTSDLLQTKNRHAFKGEAEREEFQMIILGHFYDRSLAEFVEIRLIEEYFRQGCNLLNKVVGFKDGI